MAERAEGVAAELIGRLGRARNGADGRAFGEPFAPDADLVDIRGEHHRGREAIAAGHQATSSTRSTRSTRAAASATSWRAPGSSRATRSWPTPGGS
jgi:uncharacterized protein (TIGR02246 family)